MLVFGSNVKSETAGQCSVVYYTLMLSVKLTSGVRAAARPQSDFPTITRPTDSYGPRNNPRETTKLPEAIIKSRPVLSTGDFV